MQRRGDPAGARDDAGTEWSRTIRPESCTCWTGVVLVIVVAFTVLWCNCAVAAETRVILLRGWFGVFSTGLDSLADELKAKGIKAEVAGHLYWSTAVADIVRERAAGKIGPIVLIGHSQGANNVIDAARSLQAHNIPVDLLVTLAPLLQIPSRPMWLGRSTTTNRPAGGRRLPATATSTASS